MCSEPEYTTFRELKLWLGTWNVNGKKIDENINIWMTGSVTGKPSADIYVCCGSGGDGRSDSNNCGAGSAESEASRDLA